MQNKNTLKPKKGKRKRTLSYLQQQMESKIVEVDKVELVEDNQEIRKSRKRMNKNLQHLENMNESDDEFENGMKRTSIDSTNTFELDSSVLFEPYRAIGYITSSTPFYVSKNVDERLITVSVDSAFHLYNLDKLSLIYISDSVKQKIMQLQTHKNYTYTLLSNNTIVKWRRMHIERTFSLFSTSIIQFLVIADLLIVLCEEGKLYIVDLEVGEIKHLINLSINAYMFMHPLSYLNKILIAGEDDALQIYNIEADELIYSFSNITKKFKGARILTIEQSPLIDIVGMGLESGELLIVNLKQDKIIASFSQDSPAKSISFSSDMSIEKSLLASCTTDGNILFWDLNEKKIHSVIQRAHNSKAIEKVEFLNNEPILISSSGEDNSIKMWLFDLDFASNVAPRLLKERSGHSDTPHIIKFYGEDGKHILSASENTPLRNNSLINEHISKNFSYKKTFSKKSINQYGDDIGKTLDFAFCELRERDWPNIVTISGTSNFVQNCERSNNKDPHGVNAKLYTPLIWSMENGALSKTTCKAEDDLYGIKITCCTTSHCGNFIFLGYENGLVTKFNLQSGIFREAAIEIDYHDGPITGIKTDPLNKYVITSGMDGKIKIWDFFRLKLMNTIEVEELPALSNLIVNGVNLFAFTTSKLSLMVYDVSTLKRIRVFDNIATNTITSICFSHDSRWIISTSMDKSLKVWDLLTSSLIDWVSFCNIPMSAAFSPTGEYLATTHVEKKGIFLWINKVFYGNVFIQDSPKRPRYLDLPNATESRKQNLTHKDFYEAKAQAEKAEAEEKKLLNDQIDNAFDDLLKSDLEFKEIKENTDLAKISTDPFSKWQALYYIDNIKQRNKPLDAKTKKQDAPFFLFDLDAVLQDNDGTKDLYGVQYFTGNKDQDLDSKTLTSIITESKKSSIPTNTIGQNLKQLLKSYSSNSLSSLDILKYLRSISPSAIELEVLSLTDYEFETDGPLSYSMVFLNLVSDLIDTKQDVEITQCVN